jgi:methionine-rich copper-binding protein CopC
VSHTLLIVHSTSSPSRSLVRFLATAAAAALLTAGGLAIAAPASAHDELVSTDPAADSTVDALPAELTLTFSEAIDATEGASEVQVTDAAGTTLSAVPPTSQDNVLTQPLEGTASGIVTVLWKVVSSDGHPVSGEFSFTVTEPVAPTPTPSETAAPTPTPEETEVATPSPSASPEAEDGSSDAWPWIIGGIVLVALAGGVAYLLVSRARQKRELEEHRAGSEPPADR